jgi:hypothetical protein
MILTATDHGDDTGATLTLAGNTGAASVFVSRFTGTNASRSFSLAGTITDNGDLALPDLETGAYIAVAVNGSDVSLPVGFRVTDGTDALHFRCLEAVREYVLSLNLPQTSINPDDHVIVKLPYRPDLQLDFNSDATSYCCLYFPKAETVDGGDNDYLSVDYGVQVVFARKIGQQLVKGLPTLLNVRELILESFSVSPFPDLPSIHTVNVVPGALILPEQWKLSYDCTTVVFRCLTEQPMGLF